MATSRQQKEVILEGLKSKLGGYKSVVFTEYLGLTVSDVNALRKVSRANKVEYTVAKKTLAKNVLDELSLTVPFDQLPGSLSFLGSATDDIAPAKVAATFGKEHEALRIVGGIMNGEFIAADRVLALSALPSKEELLASLVRSINAPVSGFVTVLAGNLRGLVTALTAIKDKKGTA